MGLRLPPDTLTAKHKGNGDTRSKGASWKEKGSARAGGDRKAGNPGSSRVRSLQFPFLSASHPIPGKSVKAVPGESGLKDGLYPFHVALLGTGGEHQKTT